MRAVVLSRKGTAAVLGSALLAAALWGGLRVETRTVLEGDPLVKGAWGSGEGEFGSGQGRDGLTYGPRSFAVDSEGRIVVLDWANQRLQRFDADGKLIGQMPLMGANNTSLQGAEDLAIDARGGLWLPDNLRGRLSYLEPGGDIHELRLFGETPGALLERANQAAPMEQGALWSQSAVTPEVAVFQVRRVSAYGEKAVEVWRSTLSKSGEGGPLPTSLASSGSFFYLLFPVPGEPGAALVQQHDLDGELVRSWRVPPWTKGELNRPAELLGVDTEKRFYVGTWVKDVLHVRLFDSEGRLIAHAMVTAPRAARAAIYARVGGDGNLYVAGLDDAGYQISRYRTAERHSVKPRWSR